MSGLRRAVCYARVSTEDQAQNGTSLEAQEQACLRKAADLGAVVAAVVRDEGVSGALYQARPGIQQALAHLEGGEADALVVYSVDRLSRDAEHQQAIRKRIAAAGAELVVVTLPVEDTPEGDLMYGLTGQFAEYERKVIARRTAGGSRRLAESGVQPVRAMCAFGYVLITNAMVLRGEYPAGTQGTYLVVEERAALVGWMFEQYASGAATLHSLCAELNRRGVPTPRGGRAWQPVTVSGILRNPIYKGTATWGRLENRRDESRIARGRSTATYRRARTQPAVLIPCPAIVQKATWQACQERLASNKRALGGNPKRTYLLSGIGRCPLCGRGLTGRKAGGCEHGVYACNRDQTVRHYPSPTYRSDELDGLVVKAVVKAAQSPESIRGAHEAHDSLRAPVSDAEVEAMRAELAQLERRERTAARAQVEALLDGRSPEPYEDLLREVSRRRDALRQELAAAAGSAEVAADGPANRSEAAQFAIDALSSLTRVLTFSGIGTAEKKRLLQTVVQEAVPTEDGGVRVTLRPGVSVNQKYKNTHQFSIGRPASSRERLR